MVFEALSLDKITEGVSLARKEKISEPGDSLIFRNQSDEEELIKKTDHCHLQNY